MRILALETSSLTGTVAVLEDDRTLGTRPFHPDQRTAQSFAPAIRDQLDAVSWKPQDVQLVVVTHGPGSFTGLRVGVTAAKTFAYAVGAETIGVNTLEVVACQAPTEVEELWAALNAQRKELFAARFRRADDGSLLEIDATRIRKNDDWLASLAAPVAVTGPGLKPLVSRVPDGVVVLDPSLWSPQAAMVGKVGYGRYMAGQREDLWKLTPLYLRKSAAEEKWEQRQSDASGK